MRVLLRSVAVLAVALNASPLYAQAPRKDAGVARVLSMVVPGLGHDYADEPLSGLAMIGGSVAAATYAVTQREKAVPRECTYIAEFRRDFCTTAKEAKTAPVYIGGAALAVIWLYAFADAGPAAGRANERASRVSLRVTPSGVAGRVAF